MNKLLLNVENSAVEDWNACNKYSTAIAFGCNFYN